MGGTTLPNCGGKPGTIYLPNLNKNTSNRPTLIPHSKTQPKSPHNNNNNNKNNWWVRETRNGTNGRYNTERQAARRDSLLHDMRAHDGHQAQQIDDGYTLYLQQSAIMLA